MPIVCNACAFMIAALLLCSSGCAADKTDGVATASSASASASAEIACLPAGDGMLVAQLRGALVADIAWHNNQMHCEGGPRPDGKGLRVSVVGPLPPTPAATATGSKPPAPRQLRLIFGINLIDSAAGTVQVLPTNLTVIVEGEHQLFATRGDDKCAVEQFERRALIASQGKRDRVYARGYCIAPAAALNGSEPLLIPTFEFTSAIDAGDRL
jgi:hypothetical protein